MLEKKNILLDLTIDFSLEIIKYCELLENKHKYVIARQLLKSGTSIGANAHESQNAQSKKDFIHKLKISAKEADETEYWLILCKNSENYPSTGTLSEKLLSIKKVLNKIISSTYKKL